MCTEVTTEDTVSDICSIGTCTFNTAHATIDASVWVELDSSSFSMMAQILATLESQLGLDPTSHKLPPTITQGRKNNTNLGLLWGDKEGPHRPDKCYSSKKVRALLQLSYLL